MDLLKKEYDLLCATSSDINEHLPTLLRLSSECKTVVELGVRQVVSTFALALGNPKKLRSYDLHHPSFHGANDRFEYFLNAISETKVNFSFQECDDLTIEIEECDLLFIDTWHVYSQLKRELELHGNKAKKYIAFHDTITFGVVGEDGGVGLQPAIDEFMASNPHWVVKEHHLNNNGLLVLERCKI